MQAKYRLAAVLCTVAAAVGCSDLAPTDTPMAAPAAPSRSVAAASQSVSEVTRAVALALRDVGLRQRVENDMRRANNKEHKLELSRYLAGESGGILLAKMAKETGRTRDEMQALLAGAPALEFYMPVDEHRESWTGGANLLVASSLDEKNTTLVGYDLAGRAQSLSPEKAPATPTLVLVPVEADFSRTLDMRKHRNERDAGGQAIGTIMAIREPGTDEPVYVMPIDEGCCYEPDPGTGGGGYTPPPPPTAVTNRRGISVEEFITHFRALEDHEPWTQGDPEFYLLLAGARPDIQISKRINIPEGPFDGTGKFTYYGPISLFTWDTDLGSRIAVQCFEDDASWTATFTISSTTTVSPGNTRTISSSFMIGGTDDNCGSSHIDIQNSLGEFYYIPNGVDDDYWNPAPPFYNGTSDLQWHGYGIQRL